MKFRAIIFLIFSTCCIGLLPAQEPPDLSKEKTLWLKIEAWRTYCNELLYDNEMATSRKLTDAAKRGIELVPPDSVRTRSMFSLFAGVAYENLKIYDSAIFYLEQSRQLAQSINKLTYQLTAISRLDNIYVYLNNTAMRNKNMARITAIADTSNDLRAKSVATDVVGRYYTDINNYEKSLEYSLKHLEAYKELVKADTNEHKINIGYVYSNIGNVLNEMGHHEKALTYLNEARTIIGDRVMKGNEETLYLYYLDSYIGLNNYDSVRAYYNYIYDAMANRDTLYTVLAVANILMGNFYVDKSSIDTALVYGNQALRTAKLSPNVDHLVLANKLLGRIYYSQGKYKPAIEMLNRTLDNSFEFDRNAYAEIHRTLADAYSKTKQWDSAFAHFKIYSSLRDTIATAEANKNFADAEARFQNREKADQIAAQNLQINYAAKQRQWLLVGIGLFALIAVLTFVIYQNKRKTANLFDQKNKELQKLNGRLEESNNTKARLFSIISHDLRTPISHVYQYLILRKHIAGNDTQHKAIGDKVESATASLLETMEDLLLWSKTQMNEFILQPRQICIQETLLPVVELLRLIADRKQVSIAFNIQESETVTTDSDFLQTIVRNLLANAIKAAEENTAITIGSRIADNRYFIEIINTGTPFTTSDFLASLQHSRNNLSANGMGLQLVKELADRAGIEIMFSTHASRETLTAIAIPS